MLCFTSGLQDEVHPGVQPGLETVEGLDFGERDWGKLPFLCDLCNILIIFVLAGGMV